MDIKILHKKEYPETLREASGAPESLYMRGALPPADHKYLCVVGSRKPTPYGEESVREIISGLKGYPVSIVSGLAYGIDGLAHRAALEAGLHCTAFPGSSLEWDEIYPVEHVDLAKSIVEAGGAMLSLWNPGYPVGKWAFPARNTLMAGISQATLVVQAGRGSGSLMTAKHAERFHRDVMAVPGPISNPLSYGPHMLMRRGAALISSSRDLLEELGFRVPRRNSVSSGANAYGSNSASTTKSAKVVYPSSVSADGLSMAILGILSLEDATTRYILEKTGSRASSMNERLSLLELEGLIKIDGDLVRLI